MGNQDTRIRCSCGKYLRCISCRDNILEVTEHACDLTKKFEKCNVKGTFVNCGPPACKNCVPVEAIG